MGRTRAIWVWALLPPSPAPQLSGLFPDSSTSGCLRSGSSSTSLKGPVCVAACVVWELSSLFLVLENLFSASRHPHCPGRAAVVLAVVSDTGRWGPWVSATITFHEGQPSARNCLPSPIKIGIHVLHTRDTCVCEEQKREQSDEYTCSSIYLSVSFTGPGGTHLSSQHFGS